MDFLAVRKKLSAKVWGNVFLFDYFDQNLINIDYFDFKKYLACTEKFSVFADIIFIFFGCNFDFLRIVEKMFCRRACRARVA